MRAALRDQVLQATTGRDRVTDFVKAAALLLVVIGHSLAWFVLPDGRLDNTLNHAASLWWLTWVLQILPLFFFIAGAGMVRLAQDRSAAKYLQRAAALMEPAVLLFVFSFITACILTMVAPIGLQRNLGVLMVQLTWFLGGYMLYIALAPVLIRINGVFCLAMVLCGIAIVDWLRLHVCAPLGWLNMVIVWAFFAVIGTRKADLLAAPTWLMVVGVLASVSAAAALIEYGPYSKALITANGVPGISNLAPPTLVLACAGVAQILTLVLVWPLLQRWLQRDALWIPVAVFASRAMQVYLYHMLFLILAVSPFIARRITSSPLSIGWWSQHAVTFLVTLAVAMVAAPTLRRVSAAIARHVLPSLWPKALRGRLGRISRGTARAIAATTGVLLLVQSTTGIGDPLTPRTVIGVPVYPLVTWVLLMLCIGTQIVGARSQNESQVSDTTAEEKRT